MEIKRCDICGKTIKDSYLNKLAVEYRIDGVEDMCNECWKEVCEVGRKFERFMDSLKSNWMKRWIESKILGNK